MKSKDLEEVLGLPGEKSRLDIFYNKFVRFYDKYLKFTKKLILVCAVITIIVFAVTVFFEINK
jgi:hypothetical protein